jgi:hypothetical protein
MYICMQMMDDIEEAINTDPFIDTEVSIYSIYV